MLVWGSHCGRGLKRLLERYEVAAGGQVEDALHHEELKPFLKTYDISGFPIHTAFRWDASAR